MSEQECSLIRKQIFESLNSIPEDFGIYIGTWLKHNAIVSEVAEFTSRKPTEFKMLDVKGMANLIVDDLDRVKTIYQSTRNMSRVIRSENSIKISNVQMVLPGNVKKAKKFCIKKRFEALAIKKMEPNSIDHILSPIDSLNIQSDCFVTIGKVLHSPASKIGLFQGTIVSCHDHAHRQNTTLRPLDLDYVTGQHSDLAETHFTGLAFVSASARFLAKTYNKDHRPEGCKKIIFLVGTILVEKCDDPINRRVFYAETQRGNASRYTLCESDVVEFCDSAGNWKKENVDESVLRFALMCHKLSTGDFILAGLRGVFDNGTIRMITPALLSGSSSNRLQAQCIKPYINSCRREAKKLLKELTSTRDNQTCNVKYDTTSKGTDMVVEKEVVGPVCRSV